MKYKYAYCLLATSIAAMTSNLSPAQASSIQVLPPSTSKFQVIGTNKSVPNKPPSKPMTKESPEKVEKVIGPEMKANPVAAVPTTPQSPTMPKMRTGEAELPIVQVNETKGK